MGTTPRKALMVSAGAVLALIGLTAAARAQDKPWPPPGASYYGDKGVPDISGLWMGQAMGVPGEGAKTNSGQSTDRRPPAYWTPWPLPYTAAYQKIFDERADAAKKGRQLGDIGAKCLPFGVPFMLSVKVYPEEIEQTPGRVTFRGWSTFPITIWTDGRDHPKDLTPSYNGHSIGRWVGDTLFVDTTGIRGDTPLDGIYSPHSGKLRIKWSIRAVAKNVLHFNITLFDEDAFVEPVTMTNIWHRKETSSWQMIDDASCFDGTTAVKESTPEGFQKY